MKHLIKIELTPHGVLGVRHAGRDQQYCEAGEQVILNWQPDAKWGLQEAHYTDGDGNVMPIDLTRVKVNGKDVVVFTMPNTNITVGGTFKRFVVQDWTEGQNPSVGDILVVGENGEASTGYPKKAFDAELNKKKSTLVDEFNVVTNKISSAGYAPFILTKNNQFEYIIKSIHCHVESIGKLYLSVVSPFEFSKIVSGETTFGQIEFINEKSFDVDTVGDVTIKIDDYHVPSGYYVAFCKRGASDNFTFKYKWSNVPGETYNQFVFFNTSNIATFALRSQCLSMTINIETLDTIPSLLFRKMGGSVLNGARLSILGDSISTFAGYIPSGNATFYPNNYVSNVDETWWMKVCEALGLVLDTNESWSGSRVTTTNGASSAGCGDRCEGLGNPNIIFFYMGINDFDNEVQLGTYDGKSSVPSTTTTFREAYAIALSKMLSKYKTADIYCFTLPQVEQNSPTGFPEINGDGVALIEYNAAIKELAEAFGVKVIDLNECGINYYNLSHYDGDNLHPNVYGHSKMANYIVSKLDPYVGIRY